MTILRTLIITCALLFMASTSIAEDAGAGTGIVAETMVSGGYRYVRIEADDSWVASSPVDVAVGDKVRYSGGAVMKDFTSRTLERTFDYILFVTSLEVVTEVNADLHADIAAHNPAGIEKSTSAAAPQPGEITPLDGGKTIADIHAGAEQLKDQQVALRARVMKVSIGIVGKNWITLEDGTGTAPNKRLIATTLEEVGVGDLVTVKGVIHTNVDLGSGYNYSVLLEEATFTR